MAAQTVQERAIEVYRWALTNYPTGQFKKTQVPGIGATTKLNQMAFSMLENRGLLKARKLKNIATYEVSRVCDPAQCLAVDSQAMPFWRGVRSYKVPQWAAANFGGSDELQKYAIGKIVKS
jgi:hypothetical protein